MAGAFCVKWRLNEPLFSNLNLLSPSVGCRDLFNTFTLSASCSRNVTPQWQGGTNSGQGLPVVGQPLEFFQSQTSRTDFFFRHIELGRTVSSTANQSCNPAEKFLVRQAEPSG